MQPIRANSLVRFEGAEGIMDFSIQIGKLIKQLVSNALLRVIVLEGGVGVVCNIKICIELV